MSFWTRISGNQLRAAVRIQFYGNEDAASVELAPEPTSESAIMLQTTLFLSYYIRMLCDLRSEQLESLKAFMEMAGKDIIAFERGQSSVEKISILGSQLHLQSMATFGITRTHTGELYEKQNGAIYPQFKWSPSGIDKYGPFSVIYYYQSLIDYLPKTEIGFIATRITNIHNYIRITGGKPNITQVIEALNYGLDN